MIRVNIPQRNTAPILGILLIGLTLAVASAEDGVGDPARGRALFQSDRLNCVRCHATSAEARPRGGPNLAGLLKRQTPAQVAGSIREPGRVILKGFETERVRIRDGLEVTGVVVSEANAKVTVLLTDGVQKAFHRGEVLDRAPRPGSIMPAKALSPDELKDLLSYLGTL